jgi:hypothetical protein
VNFSLPDSIYGEHLFILVDSQFYDDSGDYPEELKGDLPEVCESRPNIEYDEFDTIIIDEEIHETIRKVFGTIDIWRNSLLHLLNSIYGFNARTLESVVLYG